MKNLIIIGAGGMGKEVFYTAKNSVGFGCDFMVKGFLDDDIHSMDCYTGYPSILNTISDYKIQSDDVFVCSIGDVQTKKRVCEALKLKGAVFHTLIHKNAQIRQQVKIGAGTIVDWNATIGSNVEIGENCLIQVSSIIGHDCHVGNYSRIDTNVVCVGGIRIGNCVTIHTASVIGHKVAVEDNSIVGAMSFVIRKVQEGITVQGNPAKKVIY